MPKVVAVIGASNDRRKFGNKAVRAFLHQGYTVVPINPAEREVEGLQAYASVLDFPGAIDMASFYVPPPIGWQVIEEVARKQIPEIWLNPGAESVRSKGEKYWSERFQLPAGRRSGGGRTAGHARSPPAAPVADSRRASKL